MARNAVQKGGKGKCAACEHPELAAIDAALVEGVPLRRMAKQFGVSPPSLLRHKASHLGRELVGLKPARTAKAQAGSVLSRAEKLTDRLEELWDTIPEDRVGVLLSISDRLV